MARATFVIVGAGLAGAKAAEALRAEGFDGRVVLIGEEPERPYERPPLSKDHLRGERDDTPYVHDASFYAEHDVELRTETAVAAIDPHASTVTLAAGEAIRFDRLLLTTGARPRPLPVPGGDHQRVVTLRTVADSGALRERLTPGTRLVAIGAGWIGSEVAASARQRGCEVTLVEMTAVPLERVLGPELGAFYRDVHLDHGVRFIGGARVEAIGGGARDDEPVAVRLGDGQVLEADLVLAGVGVAPRAELAQAAGLPVDDGVLVDERLQTAAPAILAAGDVANAQHPFFGERVRVEHWHNAIEQGTVAGRNLLGRGEAYDRLPYFFSDQYDVGMEYAGLARRWDRVVFRGDPAAREFVAFWLLGDRVAAAMNVNVWDVTDDLQRLIRSRAAVDDRRLADPDVPIGDLVPAGNDVR
jgi:3-phenylpropionate/trans-cinnamate dioxygenase ferredoxin reductase subunit